MFPGKLLENPVCPAMNNKLPRQGSHLWILQPLYVEDDKAPENGVVYSMIYNDCSGSKIEFFYVKSKLCSVCLVAESNRNRDRDSSVRLREAMTELLVVCFQTNHADSCSSIFESLSFAVCSSNRT